MQATPAKIVVGMQHTMTTFHGTAVLTKKSADACLFCFTGVIARTRLPSGVRNSVQSGVACPWGAGNRG
jgi:hypothetical protein